MKSSKNPDEIIAKCVEELQEFQKTGKTQKEIVTLELQGEDAIRFRLITGLADDDKKARAITQAFNYGILETAKIVLDEIKRRMGGEK